MISDPTNHAFGRDVVWCAPAYANKHMYVRNDKEDRLRRSREITLRNFALPEKRA